MPLYDFDQQHDPGSVGAGLVWKRRSELFVRNSTNTQWTPMGSLDIEMLGGLSLTGGDVKSVITGKHGAVPIVSPDMLGCLINGVPALDAASLAKRIEDVRDRFAAIADSSEGGVEVDTSSPMAASLALGSGVLYAPGGNETLTIPRPWYKDADGNDTDQASVDECVATLFCTHFRAVGIPLFSSEDIICNVVDIAYPDPSNKLVFKVSSKSIRKETGDYVYNSCSFAYIVAAVRY